jgi:hypothetical protein
MNAAERVEKVFLRFEHALTLDQAIIVAACEAAGRPLDPRRRDDAAEILHAELLLELGATVSEAIATAHTAAHARGTTAAPRWRSSPSLAKAAPTSTDDDRTPPFEPVATEPGSTTGRWWECPCGRDHPASGARAIVSLTQPACPFCGRKFREEYKRDDAEHHVTRGSVVDSCKPISQSRRAKWRTGYAAAARRRPPR